MIGFLGTSLQLITVDYNSSRIELRLYDESLSNLGLIPSTPLISLPFWISLLLKKQKLTAGSQPARSF
jgi:hypothetical protein